jgi:hypothetical protein
MCDWICFFLTLCESVNPGTGSSFGGRYRGNRRKIPHKTLPHRRGVAVGIESRCDDLISHLLRNLEFTANLEIFQLEGGGISSNRGSAGRRA